MLLRFTPLLAVLLFQVDTGKAEAARPECERTNWKQLENILKEATGYRGRVHFDKDEVITVSAGNNSTRCGVYVTLSQGVDANRCLAALVDKFDNLPASVKADPELQARISAIQTLVGQGFAVEIDKTYLKFSVDGQGMGKFDDVPDVAGGEPETTGVRISALSNFLENLSRLRPCRTVNLEGPALVRALKGFHAQ